MKTVQAMYVFLGFLFMALGVLGLMLPVMPTMPFLFAAYWFFKRGSKKFNIWYEGTKIHKYYVKSVNKFKSMSLRKKICWFAVMTVFLICVFSVWIALAPYAVEFVREFLI